MIRSNVPMPLLFRLHMRAKFVARRAQSSLLSRHQRDGIKDERAIWAKGSGGRHQDCSPELWADFIDHYERFTDALACGAKDGCSLRVEREFTTAKRWFDKHYRSVAARVRPYLDVEFNGDKRVAVMSGDFSGVLRHQDMLEALIAAPSLKDLLLKDTGDLLPRIGRISDAVYRCHETFRAS